MAIIKTFEQILTDMLARVPDNLDKREGAIIYDALASAATELADMYTELQNIEDQAYIDTATDTLLRTKGAEVLGDTGLPATFATRKGEFKDTASALFDVPLGSRYRLNDVVYEVTVKTSLGIFELIAETAGIIGNIDSGFMIPITNVPNLGTAELDAIPLILGEDAETDEEYRARYISEVTKPPQDGNIAQYVKWANEFPIGGIGRTKVFSLWNGANSVKQSILDENNDMATGTLVDDYQEYLDPLITPGEGEGQAPIGSVVTITTSTELTVNTTATVVLASGFNIAQAIAEVEGLLATFYRDSVNYLLSQVTVIETGFILLGAESILSAVSASILLNTFNADLALTDEQIPIVGAVNLSV